MSYTNNVREHRMRYGIMKSTKELPRLSIGDYMGRLTRVGILAVGILTFVACLSTKRTPAPLSDTKSLEEASRVSMGTLALKTDTESVDVGQGTIIAETADQYVGMTSLTALRRCLPMGNVQDRCWFRVADKMGKATLMRVQHYMGEAKFPVEWEEFSNGQPVSLAMFGINKSHASHNLKPVEISTAPWPQDAVPVKVVAQSSEGEHGTLLDEQMATAWVFKDELLYTSAPFGVGTEGAPLFVYVPSQTDMRMLWRLAGIVGRDETVPVLMARSLANLLVMRKQYPNFTVWSHLRWDEKSLPPSSGRIDIQSLSVQSTTGKERFRVIMKQAEFKEKLFSVSGFPLSNQGNLDVKTNQDLVTIEFDAEEALRHKRENLKWIYFEYFDADEKPIFTACLPRLDQSKDYECGKLPRG